MIRVLVIDDHPIVRQGLVATLEDEADFEVVAAAGSAGEALALAARHHPDVALLDLELPDQNGVEALPRLLATCPRLRVLVLTAYDADERVLATIRAGAKGYLLKGAPVEEIVRGIRVVHGGGSHLEPRVAAKLLAEVSAPRRGGSRLSERERAVLRLIAAGLATKQMARSLGITERTVQFHVTSILNKLGADNRAQAVALAIERELL